MAAPGPVQRTIEAALSSAFAPQSLQVLNESHMHSVPPDSETHFKVVIVSEAFAAQALVKRHRAVHKALARPLAEGVHALSIEALTPEQWSDRGGQTQPSPRCPGGSKDQ